jgi:hypothetical protein
MGFIWHKHIIQSIHISWRTAMNSLTKCSWLSWPCSLNSWAIWIVCGWNHKSCKMQWMVLSDKFEVVACCNAQHLGHRCIANLTLFTFSGGADRMYTAGNWRPYTTIKHVKPVKPTQNSMLQRNTTVPVSVKLTANSSLCSDNWSCFSICN